MLTVQSLFLTHNPGCHQTVITDNDESQGYKTALLPAPGHFQPDQSGKTEYLLFPVCITGTTCHLLGVYTTTQLSVHHIYTTTHLCASQVPPARMPLLPWCLLLSSISASPLPGSTTQPSTPPPCSTHGAFQLPGFQAAGDLMIGGIFPLHYRVELPITNYTSVPQKAQCHG